MNLLLIDYLPTDVTKPVDGGLVPGPSGGAIVVFPAVLSYHFQVGACNQFMQFVFYW